LENKYFHILCTYGERPEMEDDSLDEIKKEGQGEIEFARIFPTLKNIFD